jgi:acetolactate synthase regulatory subunit
LSDAPNIELNMVVDSDRDRTDLKAWFDEFWSDTALVEDVKAKVLEYLAQLYVDHSPGVHLLQDPVPRL